MGDEKRMIAGRYRLDERLGGGGMGVVWRAHDELLQRTVAAKQVRVPGELTGAQVAEVKRGTMREGRIAARLAHRHAVTVFDVVEDDGLPYLIMEYVPSRTLDEQGVLAPDRVAEIGAQLAAALAAAHAVGVVHRDVKPGNVLLGDDGTVKITDFGISRVVADVTGTTSTSTAGTPAFLAPEVARGGEATFPSDVYSLGATLYTAVEGRPPSGSSGDNAMAVLHRIASGEADPPRQAGPLTELLTGMLAADPDLRPTMAEARDALAAIAAGTNDTAAAGAAAEADDRAAATTGPQAVPEDTPVLTPSTRAESGNRRRGPLIAAAALVLVLAGALLVHLLDRTVPGTGAAAPISTSTTSAPSVTASRASTTRETTTRPVTTSRETTRPSPAQPPPAAPPNPTTPQAAISDYYALLPDDLDEGWARLTAKYQRSPAGGLGGYRNFWGQIDDVRVSEVDPAAAGTVEATVDYTFKDGRRVRERHRYWLVRHDGVWKIDESTVLSSAPR